MRDHDFWSVKAKFRLRATTEGGRKNGIKSGYRPNHVFEYRGSNTFSAYMGEIKFNESESIEPGQEKIVTVRFKPGQPIKEFFTIGRKWWVHEGPILVGEAEILEI
ncbi:hypothetical protein [Fulvivirga sp.]|uniref:hypothetical protein n=1 Tax=Fulvivirga sp. TaxID=1931237 RepID=UPI0032EDA7E7